MENGQMKENGMNKSCEDCIHYKENKFDNCTGCFPVGSEDRGVAYCYIKKFSTDKQNIEYIKKLKTEKYLYEITQLKSKLENLDNICEQNEIKNEE